MAAYFDEIRARVREAGEQVKSLGAEHKAIVDEAHRLKREMARVDDKTKAATAGDADSLSDESTALKSQVDALDERRVSLEQKTATLNTETDELNQSVENFLEQHRAADVEGEKLYFEVYKLVATLATGVLVAVTAITAGLLPDPDAVWMLGLAYLVLLACISGSVGACLATAHRVRSRLLPGGSTGTGNKLLDRIDRFFRDRYFSSLSLGGLALGVGLASIFLSLNVNQIPGTPQDPPSAIEQGPHSTTVGE